MLLVPRPSSVIAEGRLLDSLAFIGKAVLMLVDFKRLLRKVARRQRCTMLKDLNQDLANSSSIMLTESTTSAGPLTHQSALDHTNYLQGVVAVPPAASFLLLLKPILGLEGCYSVNFNNIQTLKLQQGSPFKLKACYSTFMSSLMPLVPP